MKHFWMIRWVFLASMFHLNTEAEPNQPVYKTGYSTIMALGRALYGRLDAANQDFISSQPIVIDPDTKPFVRLFFEPDEPKPQRGVTISVGFVDLANHIAHAKAIDKIEKGYFDRYLKILATETGETALKDLPNDTNPAYWTDQMLDEQQSNFNSIVGAVVGMKLANHYLGYYEKYKGQLKDNDSAYGLLDPKEWEKCVSSGIFNSLDAGYTVEGLLPFLEAFDKMPARPVWSQYFIPSAVRFAKTKKQIERIQADFFAGRKRS
jgi:hypothetical protein